MVCFNTGPTLLTSLHSRNMFKGKTAVVTGASSGIGRAIALHVACEGASLLVTGRNEDRLADVASECAGQGAAEVVQVIVDLSNTDDVGKLGKNAMETFSKIDILVNNAGSAVVCTFQETKVEEFERVFSVNARAPFLLCQAMLPALEKSEGCIVNVSSLAASQIFPKGLAYGMSKAALNHFTEALAFECSKKGVRVNGVSPGTVKTRQLAGEGGENKLSQQEVDATVNFMAACQPLGTLSGLISADDVAKAVLFLASPSANCITGHTIVIDAGHHPYHAI